MNVWNSEAILLIPGIHIGRQKIIALLHEGMARQKSPRRRAQWHLHLLGRGSWSYSAAFLCVFVS
jgi:hypothetical protein